MCFGQEMLSEALGEGGCRGAALFKSEKSTYLENPNLLKLRRLGFSRSQRFLDKERENSP